MVMYEFVAMVMCELVAMVMCELVAMVMCSYVAMAYRRLLGRNIAAYVTGISLFVTGICAR